VAYAQLEAKAQKVKAASAMPNILLCISSRPLLDPLASRQYCD
jgi:hypothetical protein